MTLPLGDDVACYRRLVFMYRIGEFSKLAKTTVKTLRYYEREGILIPEFVDENGYRYYTSKQLLDLARIVHLRQCGLTIEDIKSALAGENLKTLLAQKKHEIENMLVEYKYQLSKINYLLEEKDMKYEVFVKELPECIVYYKEGIIPRYSDAAQFILSSAEECLATNPDIKCVEPDYCFMSYLDGEYKENNIRVRYCQAVTEEGIPNETIKFMRLAPVKAVCIYHKGHYENIGAAYGFIFKYIEENGYTVIEPARERYIDGVWNKDNPDEWLTEIQVPVK